MMTMNAPSRARMTDAIERNMLMSDACLAFVQGSDVATPNVQALAPLGRGGASKRDGGLKLRIAWLTEQPQRLSSRALFGLGCFVCVIAWLCWTFVTIVRFQVSVRVWLQLHLVRMLPESDWAHASTYDSKGKYQRLGDWPQCSSEELRQTRGEKPIESRRDSQSGRRHLWAKTSRDAAHRGTNDKHTLRIRCGGPNEDT